MHVRKVAIILLHAPKYVQGMFIRFEDHGVTCTTISA
jgi:hypothetical protein